MNLTDYLPAVWRMKTNKAGGGTVGAALDDIIIRLDNHSDLAGLDAQEVMARVMNRPRSWVMAHPEAQLTAKPAASAWRLW